MSELERRPEGPDDEEDGQGKGPNLIVLYGLLALALGAAIGLALLIVFPFYRRR
ncbi:MAG: hypothetical protein ABR905_04610 [Terracidiphilus sp.]|jgi:hypothetical protein